MINGAVVSFWIFLQWVVLRLVLHLPVWAFLILAAFEAKKFKENASKDAFPLLGHSKFGRPRRILRDATADDQTEMERGAAAWFRLQDAMQGVTWTGDQVSESRRAAAMEIREASQRAMTRLTEAEMSPQDRAWLAFGLEQLAEEVQREPASVNDHIAVAIHNRHTVRMAEELVRQLPARS
ncbi:hypothetical protein [Fimbriimonas ginsengisoli]|nr:hypothetical protein [Fimbriimonas ginsengisoli]